MPFATFKSTNVSIAAGKYQRPVTIFFPVSPTSVVFSAVRPFNERECAIASMSERYRDTRYEIRDTEIQRYEIRDTTRYEIRDTRYEIRDEVGVEGCMCMRVCACACVCVCARDENGDMQRAGCAYQECTPWPCS